MGQEKERNRLVEQAHRYLESVGRPRLVMLGVLTVTLASGFLASVAMVHLGVYRMPVRYPVAVGVAYATFLWMLRSWLRQQAIVSDVSDDPEGLLIPSAAAFGAAALVKAAEEKERQPKKSSPFSGVGDISGFGDVGEGCGVLVILVLVAALCTLVVSAYLIVTSPMLLAELLVDGAFLGAMSRAVSPKSPPHWSRSVVRRTWIAALVTAMVFGLVGWGIECVAPGPIRWLKRGSSTRGDSLIGGTLTRRLTRSPECPRGAWRRTCRHKNSFPDGVFSPFTSPGDGSMHKRMKTRPQLESLESMTLLSGMAATAVSPRDHAEVAITTPAPGATLTLSGTERGRYVAHRSSSGKTYDITAAGMVTPIGSQATIGNLQVVSGISSGPPNGTLYLITRQGTLTLQIPESVALPAGLPTATSANEIVDTYVITRGTGAYQGDTGSGVVEFNFKGANSARARSQVGRVSITFTTLLAPPPTSPTS